jgi:LPXTG-motif cell wall-anchored protein
MKSVLTLSTAVLLALSVPALAKNDNGNGNGHGSNGNGNANGHVKGAPGPLVGAGLPVLLIGGGIYWLVRRKNRASSSSRSQG